MCVKIAYIFYTSNIIIPGQNEQGYGPDRYENGFAKEAEGENGQQPPPPTSKPKQKQNSKVNKV